MYYLYTIIYRVCVIVTFDRFGTRSEDHGRSGAIALFLTFFLYRQYCTGFILSNPRLKSTANGFVHYII